MTHSRIRWAALPLLLTLAGCHVDREAALTGKWQVDADAMMAQYRGEKEMKAATPQQRRQMRAKMEGIFLEMKPDKTFVITSGPPRQVDWQGTWVFDKETGVATFTSQPVAEQAGETPAGKTSTFTGQLDGGNSRFTTIPSQEAHMLDWTFKKVG